jgi:hypothetical protein
MSETVRKTGEGQYSHEYEYICSKQFGLPSCWIGPGLRLVSLKYMSFRRGLSNRAYETNIIDGTNMGFGWMSLRPRNPSHGKLNSVAHSAASLCLPARTRKRSMLFLNTSPSASCEIPRHPRVRAWYCSGLTAGLVQTLADFRRI